jgi:hypothetical protein
MVAYVCDLCGSSNFPAKESLTNRLGRYIIHPQEDLLTCLPSDKVLMTSAKVQQLLFLLILEVKFLAYSSGGLHHLNFQQCWQTSHSATKVGPQAAEAFAMPAKNYFRGRLNQYFNLFLSYAEIKRIYITRACGNGSSTGEQNGIGWNCPNTLALFNSP